MKHEKFHDVPLQGTGSRTSRRKFLIIGGIIMLVIAIALGVGLGVGLAEGHRHPGHSYTATSTPTTTATIPPPNNTGAGIWQPEVKATWNILLENPLSSPNTDGVDVWDIDLFGNPKSIVSGLQAGGSKVICYFSAGSYEDWRPDADQFQSSDLGNGLDGWPGEKWLNTNSDNVRRIMSARLDMAVEKGCNGVDPDNVDGYNNDNGMGLTQDDAINYLQFLAAAAQARNLSIGLKNAGEIIPDVINLMQWSVNEQCLEYEECATFAAFIHQGKPVFHVEYPKGNSDSNSLVATSTKTDICDNGSAEGFSTIIKNMNLDGWIESCPMR